MKPKYFHIFLDCRGKVEGRGVEDTLRSIEMKYFSFEMLYYETKLFKQIWNNIITTKKAAVRNVEWFALKNEESIINKQNDRDGNFEIF